MAPVVKPVSIVPVNVPGYGMDEVVRRGSQWFKSDAVLFSDTSTANLFELPGNCLVVNMFVNVTTPYDGTGTSASATATISVPNDTGTEVLFDAGAAGLTTTGFKPATGFAKVPSSGGYAILTYTANTTTAGAFEVYMEVVQLADQL